MSSERVANVALVLLSVCAVAVTGLVVRRELRPSASEASQNSALYRPKQVPDWRRYAVEGHRSGPREAAATITVFSDLTCGACAELSRRLQEVVRKYPATAVVYRHFPLPNHPMGRQAAVASECAGRQGAFGPFKDSVFANQNSVGLRTWTSFALAAGVRDTIAFQRCLAAETDAAVVDRDMAAARRLGITATPTYLVNDVQIRGTLPEDSLESLVRRAGSGSSL